MYQATCCCNSISLTVLVVVLVICVVLIVHVSNLRMQLLKLGCYICLAILPVHCAVSEGIRFSA